MYPLNIQYSEMPYKRKRKYPSRTKPSYRKRKWTRKRSRALIPRSYIKNDFFATKFNVDDAVKQIWTVYNGTASQGPQMKSLVFSLDQCGSGAAALARNFECYKINKIVIKWTPVMTEIQNTRTLDSTQPSINSAVPEFMTLIDRNDTLLPPSTGAEDYFRNHRKTRITKATRGQKISFVPSLLAPVFAKTTTDPPNNVDFAYRSIYNQYVHLNEAVDSLTVEHFGMKVLMTDSLQQDQFVMRPQVSFYVSFRQRVVN